MMEEIIRIFTLASIAFFMGKYAEQARFCGMMSEFFSDEQIDLTKRSKDFYVGIIYLGDYIYKHMK